MSDIIRSQDVTLLFDIEINTEEHEVSQLWLTFSHSNALGCEVFTKTIEDVIFEKNIMYVNLSQEETLQLNRYNKMDKVVYIQLRAIVDGLHTPSEVCMITVGHLLKEGVME